MDTTNIADELDKLLNELDDESLSKMTDDDVIELRKKLNPYGRTIEGSDNILTYSYTDLRYNYLRRLVTTSMIGFLNRMCDEWKVPDGIPVIPVYEHLQNPEKLGEFEKTLQQPELMRKELDENAELMKKRVIIKEFLEDMFQYNPDFHVRSAYKPNLKDPERDLVNSPAGQLAIYQLKKTNPEFSNDWVLYEREKKKNPKHDPGSKLVSDIRKYCTEMIPADDIFHKHKHYYETNYEELKSIVNDLYCEKPELETALNPYQWHGTEDEADKFIDKHKTEVISTIYKAHSGKWNIFAPYKKVRESMRFFNDKTQVLEEIAKQIERDSKLGADLMKKRIKVKKTKNIKENGPDDPGFLKWKEQNDTLKQMGGESMNEKDYAPEDCPDDAITVPVFRMSAGGAKVEKTHFFTQAEAPTIVNGAEVNPDGG
jgi:exonuclease VII small subunit